MLTQEDLQQISQRDMDVATVEKQIGHFITGFPYINLLRPATSGDGIMVFSEEQRTSYLNLFMEHVHHHKTVKFVPASGAASRMFKHLFEFRENYRIGDGEQLLSKDQGFNSVYYFFEHIHEFAFFNLLDAELKKSGKDIHTLKREGNYNQIIDQFLGQEGLDYANLPKALLLFHDYHTGPRTAAEEHLVEAAEYASDQHHVARVHFTISPEHKEKFLALFNRVRQYYETLLNVTFDISYSVQKPSTDTIAVDTENQPVRNEKGTIIFRPGGHGALIDNLNDIDAEIIFVKNIDNIVPDRLKSETYLYKKVIGGFLVSLKSKIDEYLKNLNSKTINEEDLELMARFATKDLCLDLTGYDLLTFDEKVQRLFDTFNRPVRVCGMVRNEGEPGGGPFWVADGQGRASLQIVESSQIDMKDPVQKSILANSTHFNPVDLVCATRDFMGKKFNLKDFVDENTGFISLKSSGGKTLKAQELPGLWNGAMANWITLFVETPIITFNPVKTVNDLLRSEHRSA